MVVKIVGRFCYVKVFLMLPKYSRLAVVFHWVMALGIFIMFPLGIYMASLALSPKKLQLYSYHKWLGVSIFVLVLLRLLWRIMRRPPALPSHYPEHIVWLSKLGHAGLYFFMLAVPISGWLMSSAMGFPTVWFGVLPLPDLVARDKELADTLLNVHIYLNFAFVVLIIGHVLAALKHHYIDKEPFLNRML